MPPKLFYEECKKVKIRGFLKISRKFRQMLLSGIYLAVGLWQLRGHAESVDSHNLRNNEKLNRSPSGFNPFRLFVGGFYSEITKNFP